MASTTSDRRHGVNGGMAIKVPCRVATTAAITLSGLQTIDGVLLVADDRVLVKNQASNIDNGIYTADSGDWIRALDCDGANDLVNGSRVSITDGSVSAGVTYSVSGTNPITVGTTAITFSAVTSATATTTNALNSATTVVNVSSAAAPSAGQVLTATSGTAATWQNVAGSGDMVLASVQTVTGAKTFGSAGAVSKLKIAGTTSGATTLDTDAVAGAAVVTIPAVTDTLIGKATTDTLTNKTFDTAGAGNSFSINAVAVTDNTGTGKVVRDTSPTLITPNLGTPSALVGTNITGTAANLTAGTVTTNANLTGDVTSSGNATTIGSNKVTNSMLAQVATATIKGRSTAGTGNPEDLTGTQVTALLSDFVGDAGAGGTKGLVPAPAIGDAAKFLRGDKTWQTISGGGDALVANPLSQFAATTSLQLKNTISDETGSGSLVFATSPTLVTPNLGVASATSLATTASTPFMMTNGQVVSVVLTAQTVGAASLVIPDFANVNDEFTFKTKAQTLSNKTFVTPALGTPASGVLTNCTGTASGLTAGTATVANGLKSATTTVVVSAATAPSANQVLTASNSTTASWVTPTANISVQSVADAATITPNADTDNCVDITAIAQNFTIANPTGTPTNFQKLTIRIKDNGTARTITFGSGYVAGGIALPTTTVLSKIMHLGFQYNTANALNKWQLIALAQET